MRAVASDVLDESEDQTRIHMDDRVFHENVRLGARRSNYHIRATPWCNLSRDSRWYQSTRSPTYRPS